MLTKSGWTFPVYVDVRSSRWALQVSYSFISYTSIKEKETTPAPSGDQNPRGGREELGQEERTSRVAKEELLRALETAGCVEYERKRNRGHRLVAALPSLLGPAESQQLAGGWCRWRWGVCQQVWGNWSSRPSSLPQHCSSPHSPPPEPLYCTRPLIPIEALTRKASLTPYPDPHPLTLFCISISCF